MSAPTPIETDPSSVDGAWSWRRLVVVGVVLFAAQVGFIFAGGSRPTDGRLKTPTGPVVRWVPTDIDARTLATVFGVPDPAGALLPGTNGFSAEGWLRLPALPQVRIRWEDSTNWLALETNQLGEAYRLLPQQVRPLLAATGKNELPELLQPPSLPLPTPLRTASSAVLEPALSVRLDGPLPALPAFTYDSALKDSVVFLTLDDEGRVLAARLKDRSGLPDADQLAVKTAMNLPFAPRSGAGLVSGTMRFRWNTLPVSAGITP